jgi:hypothetical protein
VWHDETLLLQGAQGKGDASKRSEDNKGDDREKDDNFPVINNCFMIFGSLLWGH